MGRPSNTGERRRQFARALLKVMAKRGYEGASIAVVARAAGAAQGLLHYHFKDKREILLEAIGELAARHQARLDERLAAAGPSARARLDAFLEAHLGVDAADPEGLACWVVIGSEAMRDRLVGRAFEGVLQATLGKLREILDAGARSGELRCDDTAAAAAAVVALIQGYFVLAASARGAIPKKSALASARRMALGLVGGKP